MSNRGLSRQTTSAGKSLGRGGLRQDVDERGVARAPHRRGLLGREHARALEGCGRRRAIVALPIRIRLRRRVASARRERRDQRDAGRPTSAHRGFEPLVLTHTVRPPLLAVLFLLSMIALVDRRERLCNSPRLET